MAFPAFFDQVRSITLRDPLAAFLGASPDGTITYSYSDAVKLAGHSCPAVAGAYLMVMQGLDYIYDGELPVRGDIEVHMLKSRDHGTTGVVASVATLITGAASNSGFHGIGPEGLFSRRNLLHYDAEIDATIALRRKDTGKGVLLDINTDHVPHHPDAAPFLARALANTLSEADHQRFAALWQDRVKRMLVDHIDDPKLIHLYDWTTAQ